MPRLVADADGERLDRFLARAAGSRAAAQRLIEGGAVTVAGRPRPKRHLLSVGDVVEWEPLVSGAPAAPATGADRQPPRMVYVDEHLLVVDKPAGLVVHPGRGHPDGTLAQALSGWAAGGDDPRRAGIVHRLDRDTSGLIVVARSEEAHRRLKAALAARRLGREYLALVEGLPQARSGTIDAPIGRDPRDRTRMAVREDEARAARTHFSLERALPSTTLLRVSLETGRTHQIRVHMQAIGHPVCGDPQYGTAGRYGLERQFLHAARLRFPHPFRPDEQVDVSAPLPEDLERALALAVAGP